LDRVIAKWRAQVRRALPHLIWQANYFEHQLRPAEPAESYAWYIFMNPYRGRVVDLDLPWPGWWTDGSIIWDFLSIARPGPCPHHEWLTQVEKMADELMIGEE
jgi:hypothetical protein